MKDYNDRLWNKIFKSKEKPFRIRRSFRNVQPDQIIKTRYGVLIEVAVPDNLVLYITPIESYSYSYSNTSVMTCIIYIYINFCKDMSLYELNKKIKNCSRNWLPI